MTPPLPVGKFGTIIADPAWSFKDTGTRLAPAQPGNVRYTTMPLRDIAALDVKSIAADSAHLYLWVPSALLADGLTVMAAWGFVQKTTIIWVKRAANGNYRIGGGHYVRAAHELVLFGIRGRCPAAIHNIPSVFEAPRGKHSAKPERLHEIAELMSPGPRLEMFARSARPGWTLWGLQAPTLVIEPFEPGPTEGVLR